MDSGFFISYFSEGEVWGANLPQAILPDATLDASIEQLGDAIRTWILEGQSGPSKTLSIVLYGPIEGASIPRIPPEQHLAEAKTQVDRFYALTDVAMSRFDAGDLESAKSYALELQKMMLSYRDNWNFGNAVQSVNLVLGRLALKNGDVEEAERYLLEAGKSVGSPQMDTFGPNMSLAQDLLIAGHSGAVLEYFRLCAGFWLSEFSKLDQWTEDVQQGRIPDFGANLDY